MSEPDSEKTNGVAGERKTEAKTEPQQKVFVQFRPRQRENGTDAPDCRGSRWKIKTGFLQGFLYLIGRDDARF